VSWIRVLGIFGCICLVLATGPSASAHTGYESSEPGRNEAVPEPPERVTVRFDREVDANSSTLRVLGPDGADITDGDTQPDPGDPGGQSLVVALQDDLPDGVYTVEWTVVDAEDGDATDDSFTFAVGEAATFASPSVPVVTAPTGTVEPANDDDDDSGIGRGSLILGLVAIVVALAVVATVGGRRLWR
jgi:copper transport protein